jgi:hypothetical protein
MAERTSIVLTMYGKGENVESVSVNFVDNDTSYYADQPAGRYCQNINELELSDNRWIYAQIIKENQKVPLRKPLQFDVILQMDNRDLQLVLSKLQPAVVLRILKGADEEVRAKIFNNMSKSAAACLKEDLLTVYGIGADEISAAKMETIEIIQKLSADGSIKLAWGKK